METDREELIRRRAYELWESEERPQGEAIKHWLSASEELSASDSFAGAATQDNGEEHTSESERLETQDAPASSTKLERDGTGAPLDLDITTGERSPSQAIKGTEGP